MRRIRALLAATATLVLVPLLAPEPSAAVGPLSPQDGLVLHYAMETLSQATVRDESASALHGRVVSAGSPARLVAGRTGYGRALELLGSQRQYVDVPRSTILDVDRYTLSAWVRPTGVENPQTFERWEVLEKAGAYWMNVRTNGRVRVGGFFGGCANANWKYFDSTRAIPMGQWRHVAATYDGTWPRVFINGTAAGSTRVTGRTCASGEPLAVGAKNAPAKGLLEAFWDGRLDDVRVYNRALSLSEIGQLAS